MDMCQMHQQLLHKTCVRIININTTQQHTKLLQNICTPVASNLIHSIACFKFSHYLVINSHRLKNLHSTIGLNYRLLPFNLLTHIHPSSIHHITTTSHLHKHRHQDLMTT